MSTASFFPLTAEALVEKITDGLKESPAGASTITLKEYRDPMVLHQRFHPESDFVASGKAANVRAGYSKGNPEISGVIAKAYATNWQKHMGTISRDIDFVPERERGKATVSVIEITVDKQTALDLLPKVQEMADRQKPKGKTRG